MAALVVMFWLYGQLREAQDTAALRLLEQAAEANFTVDPELSVRLALDAVARSPEPKAVELLHRALAESRLERRIPAHSGQATAVAFRPSVTNSGQPVQFATAGKDGRVRLWDAESGASLLDLPRQESGVNAVAFSSDGSRLATGHEDGSAAVWDFERLPAALLVVSNTAAVRSVALSPDANLLLVGTAAGTTLTWDVKTGEKVLALPPNAEVVGVNRVLFLPSSSAMTGTPRLIAVADEGGEIRLWNMDEPDEPLRALRYWDEYNAETLGLAVSPEAHGWPQWRPTPTKPTPRSRSGASRRMQTRRRSGLRPGIRAGCTTCSIAPMAGCLPQPGPTGLPSCGMPTQERISTTSTVAT